MDQHETLETRIDGGVAVVVLNRPEVRNAFNAQMIAELTDVAGMLSRRSDVRVVVLEGKGKAFSGGADISWMRASLQFGEADNVEDARRMAGMFEAINSLPQAVLARVHGAALGGGMGLIAVCDVAVAEGGTVFGFTEAKLGILPAVISPFVLPKIGESWARALFLTARRFDAELARQIGLIHVVCDVEDLDRTIQETIDELLGSGPQAVRESKALIRDVGTVALDERRDLTASRIARVRTSQEGQEGLRAFLEKRRPTWRDA